MKIKLALIPLLSTALFAQIPFTHIAIQPSTTPNLPPAVHVLPNGHVEARNASLALLLAAVYHVPESSIKGGPDWVTTEHFDLDAQAAPSNDEPVARAFLELVGDRFHLMFHISDRSETAYALKSNSPYGPKPPASANRDRPGCEDGTAISSQIHRVCHDLSMAKLAALLPELAPNYVGRTVVDETGLTGSYDFSLDWLGTGAYETAMAAHTAAGSKGPAPVGFFDALANLGLHLEERNLVRQEITIESAARPTTSNIGPAAPSLSAVQLAAIDLYVAKEMASQHIPGLAVGIYNRGQILLAKGYGVSNVEHNVAVKAETIFQSGSVGKQFASAAVMMLVEQGKVGLDDSILKYFPQGPEEWRAVTVKHLLSHTSGLSEYESPERTGSKGPFYLRLDFTEGELVDKIAALPIEAKPGEKWAYRNTNYVLLGAIIHRVSGKFYTDYLAEKIFEPWGMTSTRPISEDEIIPNRAAGYEFDGKKLHNQEWVSPTFNSTADGTLYYNVLDLAKWDEALYGNSLLQQSSLDRIWTVFPMNDGKPNASNYGFGWRIAEVNGQKLVEHGGAWQGFTCHIVRFPGVGLSVAVLTNLAGANPSLIAHSVAGLVNPALAPKQRKEITLSPAVLDGYTGSFEVSPGFILTVSREGNQLFAQATGQGKVELFAESEREFFLKVADIQMTFVTDSKGRAGEVILHQGGDTRAKRIE